MSLLRFALPVLAAASAVYARDGSSCTASGTQTIQNGGDATAIASCTTFSGNIAIATGVSDDIDFGSTLTKIDGDFSVVSNSGIQRIGGASLETISGELKLSDVSQLASLSFPKLDEADKITLNGLANLRDLGFDGQVSKCSQLDIQNTQLQNLNGLNFSQCDSINIANNNAISSVAMSLTNITTLVLSFNNADVNVSFPQLESAQNITCRACGSIDISSLSTLASGLMVLDSNVESLIAPNLTKINGALTIDRNVNLKNVSFPQLTDVGKDLQIANNTKLANITGFPVLKNVGAALDLSGNLTQVSTPKLDYVKGVFNLQSTEDLGNDCDFYNDLESKGKVPKTKYVCQGKLKEAGTAGTSPSGGNKTSPATTMNVHSAYLGLAGLAAVLLV